jgi:enamine deaminase RidA (YjgF/YER057c/UK114 family)
MSDLLVLPHVEGVPDPAGRYVHALVHGGLVYLSGIGAFDLAGDIVGIGDPAAQTRQILQTAQRILEQAGSSLTRVVKETVYLVDIEDRYATRPVRDELYQGHIPASTLVGAGSLTHPDMLLEMDFVAIAGGAAQ